MYERFSPKPRVPWGHLAKAHHRDDSRSPRAAGAHRRPRHSGRSPAPGPLISNLTQFALGAGAGIAAFLAARRSGKFARKVWNLTALAIAIYTTSQGFIIYYDSIIRAPLHSPWLSDQFLFLWVVPMLIQPWRTQAEDAFDVGRRLLSP
jgi:hypothetical protein